MERVNFNQKTFALHGWLGLGLVIVFWTLNWGLSGPRTHWAFFPLWLGFCLVVDALVLFRRGTSLLARNWQKYLGLFLVSALVWWMFEFINWRLQNWRYDGAELFSRFEFFFWSTFSFTTVIPAVFGCAELAGSFAWIRRLGRGPVIRSTRPVLAGFFILGLVMFGLMWAWPRYFFPFVWLSLFFIFEPLNYWLGNRSLAPWFDRGDWRPVIALWVGVLMTAFFWEMWNYFAYPKWTYHLPWGEFFYIFEMPLLGYGGYLPFALELYALYHLIAGLFGQRVTDYVQIAPENGGS